MWLHGRRWLRSISGLYVPRMDWRLRAASCISQRRRTRSWRVTNVAAGRGAEGFDVSPDAKEIWAANAQDATVTIIDVASKRVTQTVPIPVKGANRLKFTPDGKRVLSSGLGAGAGANLVVL